MFRLSSAKGFGTVDEKLPGSGGQSHHLGSKHFDGVKDFLDEYKPHILGLNGTQLNDDAEEGIVWLEEIEIAIVEE